MTAKTAKAYETHKARVRGRELEKTRAGQDIGEMPAVSNPRRRARCDASLQTFCEMCFPRVFSLNWSVDHLRAIEAIERACQGERLVMAMPRGWGKSSLCLTACLWAVLTGRRKSVLYVGATDEKARERLAAIKLMLRWRELRKLYPKECFPFVCLDGEARKALGQRYLGEKTDIRYGAGEIQFAAIPDSSASGARIRVEGLTSSNLRGSLDASAAEELLRPDLLFVDDPQTEESSGSVTQTQARLAIIKNSLLGMEGNIKLGVIALVTVIQAGDLAELLLSDPYWIRIRSKALYQFPEAPAMKLWAEYGALCRSEGKVMATEFYGRNTSTMNAGAIVAWPDKFQSDELSAVQFCMHVFLEDEVFFCSELQNEPKPPQSKSFKLKPADILEKVNQLDRAVMPLEATHLVAMIDVQQDSLWWMVRAFRAADFTGWTVDYGAFPEQSRGYYSAQDFSPTLREVYQSDEESSIAAGLTALLTTLLRREFPRERVVPVDGVRGQESGVRGQESGVRTPSTLDPRPSTLDPPPSTVHRPPSTVHHPPSTVHRSPSTVHPDATVLLQLVMVDVAWGRHSKMLEALIRRLQKELGNVIMASIGVGIGVTRAPMSRWKRDPGRRFGQNWCYGPPFGNPHPVLQYDTNWWKSWSSSRLVMPLEQRGGHSLFGTNRTDHRMLADQLTSESYITVEARGQRVDEWKNPLRRDNHWWDAYVACAVAASYLGCKMLGEEEDVKRKRLRKPLAELMMA